MSYHIRFSLMLIFLSAFLFTPNQAFAAQTCNFPTDQVTYRGPYSTLFDSGAIEKDCGAPELTLNPMVLKAIEGADITCKPGKLSPYVLGDENQITDFTGERGSGRVNWEDISTFSLSGKLITQKDEAAKTDNGDKLIAYRKVVEAYRNYDLSALYREAYAKLGPDAAIYENFLEWACERELCIVDKKGSKHLNPSIYSAAQKTTTLKDTIINQLNVAKQFIKCADDEYAQGEGYCATFYPTTETGQERVIDIAYMVKNNIDEKRPVASYNKLNDKQKFQLRTIHMSKSEYSFVLLVPTHRDCKGWLCIFTNIFDFFDVAEPPEPKFMAKLLPESVSYQEGAQAEYNKVNPLPPKASGSAQIKSSKLYAQAQSASDAEPTSPNPPTPLNSGNAVLDFLYAKAVPQDPKCVKAPPTRQQTTGSTSEPPVSHGGLIEVFMRFVTDSLAKAKNEQWWYNIYEFSPPSTVAAADSVAKDSGSLVNRMMTLKSQYDFSKDIRAPQALTGTAKTQTVDNPSIKGYIMKRVEDPPGSGHYVDKMEPDKQENRIVYESSQDKWGQPGGEIIINKKLLPFMLTQPLKDPDHIGSLDRCLIEDHLQNGAKRFGYDLLESLNSQQFAQADCSIAKKEDGPLMCIDIGSLPTNGECSLKCNDVDGHNIPAQLREVIEKAAAAYKVPPALILAAFYAEGGFEPRCKGDDAAEIGKMMQCDLDTCCNNNTGPFGLNPFYFKKAIKQAKEKLGIPYNEDNPGNMCNLIDGALVVAANQNMAKAPYDSKFWYDHAVEVCKDPANAAYCFTPDGRPVTENELSCHGIAYAGNAPASCSGWTAQNAAAAIRFQQGLCAEGNARMDAHFQQAMGVFTMCN